VAISLPPLSGSDPAQRQRRRQTHRRGNSCADPSLLPGPDSPPGTGPGLMPPFCSGCTAPSRMLFLCQFQGSLIKLNWGPTGCSLDRYMADLDRGMVASAAVGDSWECESADPASRGLEVLPSLSSPRIVRATELVPSLRPGMGCIGGIPPLLAALSRSWHAAIMPLIRTIPGLYLCVCPRLSKVGPPRGMRARCSASASGHRYELLSTNENALGVEIPPPSQQSPVFEALWCQSLVP
jgi:hypothetical protein